MHGNTNSGPLSQQELGRIRDQRKSDPDIVRLSEEIYRVRRIAKDVQLARQAALEPQGEDARSDEIWIRMQEITGTGTMSGISVVPER